MSVSTETFICNFCGEENEKFDEEEDYCRFSNYSGNYFECSGCIKDGIINAEYCAECDLSIEGTDTVLCPIHIEGRQIFKKNITLEYDVLAKNYLDIMISIINNTPFKIGGEKYQAMLLSRNIKPAKK